MSGMYSENDYAQAGVAVHRSLGEVSDHKGRAHLGKAKQRGAQVRNMMMMPFYSENIKI